MITGIAQKIISRLLQRGDIQPSQVSTCSYGLILLLHTLLSTAGLLAAGLLMGKLLYACIAVSVFYINQSFGGYHAKTTGACFLTMLTGLLMILLLSGLNILPLACCFLCLLSFGILELLPLTLHQNKSYLLSMKKHFVRRSRIITGTELILFALSPLVINDAAIIRVLALTFTFSALSRMVGWFNNRFASDQFSPSGSVDQ